MNTLLPSPTSPSDGSMVLLGLGWSWAPGGASGWRGFRAQYWSTTLSAFGCGPAPNLDSPLPVVGLLYALIIWPVIWAFAEDNTYFGYSLPRLEALTGRAWLAVVIVSAFATLQHGFLPFRLEWQHFVYRLASSVLVIVVLCLLYLRQRRLLPIHVIHWAGNVLGIIALLLMPAGGG